MSDYTAVIAEEDPELIQPVDLPLPGSELEATVMISKVGGGTLGQKYEGRWEYWYFIGHDLKHHNDDLSTGSPVDHFEAAEILVDFLMAEAGED